MTQKKRTPFRNWLEQKWYEHVDEILAWEKHYPDELPAEYFRKYKWYLKRCYKYEQKIGEY
jgi:hypothetical protein